MSAVTYSYTPAGTSQSLTNTVTGQSLAIDVVRNGTIRLDGLPAGSTYKISGKDLIIQLPDGTSVTLENFFDDQDRPVLEVFDEVKGEYVLVEFPEHVTDGIVSPTFAAAAAGGLGTAGMIGLGLLGAAAIGGIAAAASGGGGDDPKPSQPQKPSQPGNTGKPSTPVITDADANHIEGTADPGTDIYYRNPETGEGGLLGTVGDDGKFDFDLPEGLKPGDEIEIYSKNPEGTVSEGTEQTLGVPDPIIDSITDEDRDGVPTITGEAYPGSELHVTWPPSGEEVIYQIPTGPVNANGMVDFSFDAPGVIGNGEVTAQSTMNGLSSDKVTDTYTDSYAPNEAIIDDATPFGIEGSGEPGAGYQIIDPETGEVIGKGDIGSDGKFDTGPLPGVGPGDDVEILITDTNNNPTRQTVTLGIPDPIVDSITDDDHDGKPTITGEAYPGSTLLVTWPPSDKPTAYTVPTEPVNENGMVDFSFTAPDVVTNGDVTAQSQMNGASSDEVTEVYTDSYPPNEADIESADPFGLVGTGEPGGTYQVVDPNTNEVLDEGKIGDDGKFTTKPLPGMTPGDEVEVVVTDVNGLSSDPEKVTLGLPKPAFTVDDTDNDGIPTLHFENVYPGETISVTYPDGSTQTYTVPGTGNQPVTYNVNAPGVMEDGDITATGTLNGETSPQGAATYDDSEGPKVTILNVKEVDGGLLQAQIQTEPGAQVLVTWPGLDENGNPRTTRGTAGADGKVTVTSDPEYGALPGGTVTAVGTDINGNPSKAAEIGTYDYVDNTNPRAATLDNISWDTATETGTSQSGDTIHDSTPTIHGTGMKGNRVQIYLDGQKLGEAFEITNDDGTFDYTHDQNLQNGQHSFTAVQIDPSGRESAVSDPFGFTLAPEGGEPAAKSDPGAILTSVYEASTGITKIYNYAPKDGGGWEATPVVTQINGKYSYNTPNGSGNASTYLDKATGDYIYTNMQDSTVSVFARKSDGTYDTTPTVTSIAPNNLPPHYGNPSKTLFGQFDKDGITDMWVLTSSGISIYRGLGNQKFEETPGVVIPAANLAGPYGDAASNNATYLMDFGNGVDSLVLSKTSTGDLKTISVWKNSGGSLSTDPVSTPNSFLNSNAYDSTTTLICPVDYDNDGKTDDLFSFGGSSLGTNFYVKIGADDGSFGNDIVSDAYTGPTLPPQGLELYGFVGFAYMDNDQYLDPIIYDNTNKRFIWFENIIDTNPSKGVDVTPHYIDWKGETPIYGNMGANDSYPYAFTSNLYTPSKGITGTTDADFLLGDVGGSPANDKIYGLGGADTILAQQGDDLIVVPSLDYKEIDGGLGNDTLALDGSNLTFDSAAAAKISGIEVLALAYDDKNAATPDVTGNSVNLTMQDVLDMSDTDTLRIDGNASSGPVNLAGFIKGASPETVGTETYDVYTNGAAKVLVDQDITNVTTLAA